MPWQSSDERLQPQFLRPHAARVPLGDAAAGSERRRWRRCLASDGFLRRRRRPQTLRPLRQSAGAQAVARCRRKAKSVIFLFMYGGPSHIDTFDYKPAMVGMDGKTIDVKTFGRGGHKNQGRIVEPQWKFKQYGQCGKWVSDLFPHLGDCVDDIAFLHSMTADSPIHGSAMLMMNSGRMQSGSPAIGLVGQLRPGDRSTKTCRASS